MSTDEDLMRAAIDEARLALAHDDIPIGALVVDGTGSVVAAAHNERELRGDPTAHAEVLAVRAAAESVGGWRLDGLTLVVTLEPCAMCAGALVNSRIDRLVYGAPDLKAGACASLYNLGADPRLNHEFAITGGVLGDECASLLEDFFRSLR